MEKKLKESSSVKKWVEEHGRHILYFTPFYDEYNIAELLYVDELDDWYYRSSLLDGEDFLGSNLLEDAKEDVENLIETHLEYEVDYYQHLLNRFKG